MPAGALAVTAALLTGGALAGCSSDPSDRRYCAEVATGVRVEDRPCEQDRPGYAWRYVERSSYRPAYGRRPDRRTYDQPVDDRGTRTQPPSGRSDTSGRSGSGKSGSGKSGSSGRSGSGRSGSSGRH